MSAQRPSSETHLVTLVLQSKKALQHGEQLCLRASQLSSSSARNAVDVLALDARVKWLSDAVLEQLKVCSLGGFLAPITNITSRPTARRGGGKEH